MADITNRQVILYNNEVIRPLSERMRDLDAEITSALVTWNSEISGLISGNANGDLIEDGRSGEGISRMTKADMINLVTAFNDLDAIFDGAGKRDVISKPTVRPLRT